MKEIERKFIATAIPKDMFGSQKMEFVNTETQLNIYYKTFDAQLFLDAVSSFSFFTDSIESLSVFIKKIAGLKTSLRTRKIDECEAIIVLKASQKDAVNGTNRHEYEVSFDPTQFDVVDEKMTKIFGVDSKWNRTREIYKLESGTLTVDNNSGYGLIGELEIVLPDDVGNEEALANIDALISAAGYVPLDVARVNVWYDVYCTMWERFYRTGKTFRDFEDTKHLLD